MQPTMSYTAMSQRLTPLSARPRHQPSSKSCPPFPTQLRTTFHPGGADAQPPRPMSISIPYSQALHTAPDATAKQQWSGPPPLDFGKSPYRCVPLPEMTHGPVMLNAMLAYSSGYGVQDRLDISERQPVDVRHHHHICAPATNPSLGSMTILLPNGRVVTIHASLEGQGFVTIGDVLNALDTRFLGKPSKELPFSVERTYDELEELCLCLSRTTALHALRSRYEWAGLMRNEEGFDIWDLRIG
jgi:hypothetical protein